MEQNNKLQENLEIDLIADALLEELEAVGKQAVKDNAQCDDIPFYQLKDGTNKRFARFINSRTRRESPRWRVARRAVLIAAILLSVFIATQVDAIRTVLGNYFLNREQESIYYSERVNTPRLYAFNAIPSFLRYPPDGYTPYNYSEYEGLKEVVYRNRSNETIQIIVYEDSTSFRIDGEGLDDYIPINIGGLEGIVTEKQGDMTIIWGKAPIIEIKGLVKEKQALMEMAQKIVESPDYPG